MSKNQNEWTEEETSILRKEWKTRKTNREIGRLINKSPAAVGAKAKRLNLPQRDLRGRHKNKKPETKDPIVKNRNKIIITVCGWAVGSPTDPDFHFCGDAVLPGKPYCAAHCAVAYTHYRKAEDADAAIAKDAVA